MPKFRGLYVEVVDEDGKPLREWGVHKLTKLNKTSAYVQSTTGLRFCVKVTPEIPYVACDAAAAHYYRTRNRGDEAPGYFRMEDEWEDIETGE